MGDAVRVPKFKLQYESQDITEDVVAYVLSIAYTDRLHASSSELDISMEDRLLRWIDPWYPEKGDRLNLELFYEQSFDKLDCGRFEVDDIEFTGPPDIISLSALATDIKLNLREVRTKAYENTTLKKIAEEVAARHSLELVGEILDLTFERITQNEETDLNFLNKIADDYGQIVKIENGKLIFYNWTDLEAQDSVITLNRSTISRYTFRDKAVGTYKACEIQYQDAQKKETITHTEPATPPREDGDILKIRERVENRQQAVARAREALRRANGSQVEATISLEGASIFVGGININVEEMGALSGKYQVLEAMHRLTSSQGWTCELKCRRIS